jgi:methionine-rich copper-binding protein CopC
VKFRPIFRAISFGLGLLLLLVEHGPAAAHAELRQAVPEPGAVLSTSPDEIRLTFSERLRPESTFVVFDRAFETVPGIEPELVAGEEEQLNSAVPPLAADIYTVQWNVVGVDAHPSSGSYSFEVLRSRDSTGMPWLPAAVILAAVALAAVLIFLRRRQLRQGH